MYHEIRYYSMCPCVMLHSFCIRANDPCNPHWKLSIEELELNVGNIENNKINKNQKKKQPR